MLTSPSQPLFLFLALENQDLCESLIRNIERAIHFALKRTDTQDVLAHVLKLALLIV